MRFPPVCGPRCHINYDIKPCTSRKYENNKYTILKINERRNNCLNLIQLVINRGYLFSLLVYHYFILK